MTSPGPGRTALRVTAVAALAAALALVVVELSPRPPLHGFFDLHVYRGAVRWWLEGRPPYGFRLGESGYGFTYPPFALLVLLPAALLPDRVAEAVSVVGSAGLATAITCWLVVPLARRHGRPVWFTAALAVPVALATEPVRETLGYGQVNLLVLALVLADLVALRRGRRWAGVGIGLATAVKLTPGLFAVWLVLTRRFRAAAVAAAAFGAATALAAAVDARTSWRFWTRVLWEDDRTGSPANVNNQSLRGVLLRALGPGAAERLLWVLLVLAVLALGLRRAVRAHAVGDDLAAVTLVGLTACLISPITWNHHLYWVLPATAVLVDVAAGDDRPRAVRLGAGVAAVAVVGAFVLSVQWLGHPQPLAAPRTGAGAVLDDTYALITLALLALLPARSRLHVPQREGQGDLHLADRLLDDQ